MPEATGSVAATGITPGAGGAEAVGDADGEGAADWGCQLGREADPVVVRRRASPAIETR
jgi:hypothetical protein